jgi:hypothetical protein
MRVSTIWEIKPKDPLHLKRVYYFTINVLFMTDWFCHQPVMKLMLGLRRRNGKDKFPLTEQRAACLL